MFSSIIRKPATNNPIMKAAEERVVIDSSSWDFFKILISFDKLDANHILISEFPK